jgi:hypothetical protein
MLKVRVVEAPAASGPTVQVTRLPVTSHELLVAVIDSGRVAVTVPEASADGPWSVIVTV